MSETRGTGIPLKRVQPIHRSTHDATKAYETLDIVVNASNTAAYMAVQDVPVGTALTDTGYWEAIVNVSSVVDNVNSAVNANKEELQNSIDANKKETDETISRLSEEIANEATARENDVTAEKNRAVARENEIEALFTAPTQEAVDKWLDEHPEATTTVQDGSLNEDKFTHDAKNRIVNDYVTPDHYGGTDTEKLQAALDAVADAGGTVYINRAYTLTSDLYIRHNSDMTTRVTLTGIGNESSIDFGVHTIRGFSNDISKGEGGLQIKNLLLAGTGTMLDMTGLLRVHVDYCVIKSFDFVAKSDNYIQELYINNCLIRNVGTAVSTTYHDSSIAFSGWTMGCMFTNNVIEWCEKFIDVYAAQGCSVAYNIIEGMTGTPITIGSYVHNLNIDSNYFEKNGDGVNIDLSSADSKGTLCCTISNNSFANDTPETGIIKLSEHKLNGYLLIVNNKANTAANLIYAPEGANVTHILAIGNYGECVNITNLTPGDVYGAVDRSSYIPDLSPGKTLTVSSSCIGVAINKSLCRFSVPLPVYMRQVVQDVAISKMSVVNIGDVSNHEVYEKRRQAITIDEKTDSAYEEGKAYFANIIYIITI